MPPYCPASHGADGTGCVAALTLEAVAFVSIDSADGAAACEMLWAALSSTELVVYDAAVPSRLTSPTT